MIEHPSWFDAESTYVTYYAMADGATVAHGGKLAPPAVPEGATELTAEEYAAHQIAWDEAKRAHQEAARLADDEAEAARRAAALVHFEALVALMPEATARLLSAYDGPWPVAG